MRKKFTKVILIILCIFASCNSEIGNSFKIMNDLRSKFDFNSVEMSLDDESAKFTLQDIDHNDLPMEKLQSYSIKVDTYLKNKYPRIDSLEVRKYLFSGAGGFEIVEFTFHKSGDLTSITKY